MAQKRGLLHYWEAVGLLVGTTIGAGVLGIPYVVAKSGLNAGLIDIVALGILILLINLYVGETCLRTKRTHQLAGLAEIYLGKKGKTIMAVIAFLSIVGALTAYIIGIGQVFSAILSGSAFVYSIAFFAFGAFMVYFDLYAVKKAELYMNIFVIGIIIALIAVCFSNFNINYCFPSKDATFMNLLIPYGVILFAFVGASAIPEMEMVLKNNKKKMRSAIILGTLIPFVLYFLFTIAVIGITGLGTTEVATIGLGKYFGQTIALLGNMFPLFSMSTSFFILGLALKWMFKYDYKLSNTLAWALTCFIPLALFLAGANSFIAVIGLTGAITGGMEGIMIILIAKSAKKKGQVKPAYQFPLPLILEIVIILLFAIGIAYQFIRF